MSSQLQPPDEQEMAAIVAAIEIVWPKPQVVTRPATTEPSRWRFAGRWWSKPIPVRRDRPW